jgi:hypothetical protein
MAWICRFKSFLQIRGVQGSYNQCRERPFRYMSGKSRKCRYIQMDNESSDYVNRVKELLREDRQMTVSQPCLDQLFFIRSPRWPIKVILLVVRGGKGDRTAIEFGFCLARKCHARLFTLVAVPDIPAFYRSCQKIQLGVPILFQLNTEPGRQLREIFERMVLHEITGNIQACEKEPNQQIKLIVKSIDPDLIVISQEPYHRVWRMVFGEIIRPLLRWIDRPVLVV